MEKSKNKACFMKKFSITLRTNKNTGAFLISTLVSLLKRATVDILESCSGTVCRMKIYYWRLFDTDWWEKTAADFC